MYWVTLNEAKKQARIACLFDVVEIKIGPN